MRRDNGTRLCLGRVMILLSGQVEVALLSQTRKTELKDTAYSKQKRRVEMLSTFVDL